MNDLQGLFDRVQSKKREMKELRQTYKDTLTNTPGYKQAVDDMTMMREKKKHIEQTVKQQFVDDMETLNTDIASDMILLSDLALTKIMKGETIEIKDKNETTYEPIFSVKFRKMN